MHVDLKLRMVIQVEVKRNVVHDDLCIMWVLYDRSHPNVWRLLLRREVVDRVEFEEWLACDGGFELRIDVRVYGSRATRRTEDVVLPVRRGRGQGFANCWKTWRRRWNEEVVRGKMMMWIGDRGFAACR